MVLEVGSVGGRVQVRVVSESPTLRPLDLAFAVEAQVDGTLDTGELRVELRDFSTGTFELVGVRAVLPGVPHAAWVQRSTNPARFLEPGSGRLEARLTYDWGAATGVPVVSFDRVLWRSRVRARSRTVDLSGYDASGLNTSADWIRTVFDLGPDRMTEVPFGVRLAFDVSSPGPFDYTFRSELRETNISTYPRPGTTQVYRMRFNVESLPDLYGPVTIFQRFSRTNDGPDIEVELTGANQFSDAVPNDLQVVAFGQRLRLGRMLQPENDLVVVIQNAEDGAYRVSLNGEVLHERFGIDTRASTQGSWAQFGLYPHGLHDASNRADQIASGSTSVAFQYGAFRKVHFDGRVDVRRFQSIDPN